MAGRASFLPIIALTLFAAGCRSAEPLGQAPSGDAELDRLARWMAGTFSSRAQAEADPHGYFEIRLVQAPIWRQRTDGRWFYIEQAAAGALDRPYRQRVYRLNQPEEGAFRSDVYTLPGDPLDFAGAWRDREPLADLSPDDLTPREGCSIILLPAGPRKYAGGTVGTGCESTLRGAAYATSDVIIEPDRIVSWDRGFDAQGTQVWGAEKGAYLFEKISDAPPQ